MYPINDSTLEEFLITLRDLRLKEAEAYYELSRPDIIGDNRSQVRKSIDNIDTEIRNLINSCEISPRVFDTYVGELENALEKYDRENIRPSKPSDCSHERIEIRLREHGNNSTHVVSQCIVCGGKRKDHQKSDWPNWQCLPKFDDNLRQDRVNSYSRWWEKMNEVKENILGSDGSPPKFDHTTFKASFSRDNPEPICKSNCSHEKTNLTRRSYGPGNDHAVIQCICCGRHEGSKPKKEVPEIGELPTFDGDLEELKNRDYSRWFTKYMEELEKAKKKFDDKVLLKLNSGELKIDKKNTFSSYYSTPEWERTRLRIFNRDAYVCQACKGVSECVHHITYERLGEENDVDLISLCVRCHDEVHRRQNLFFFSFRLTPNEVISLWEWSFDRA